MKPDPSSPALSRRVLLRGLGASIAIVPFSRFLGCGPTSTGATDAATLPDATAADTTALTDGAIVDADVPWATGGTAAMTGSYPNPFAAGLGATCDLTCSATIGPCYAVSPTRVDISEGQAGLPVRLAFKIVDAACNPVVGATIEIWHCGPNGEYSGNAADSATLNVAFCTGNDPVAMAARFFRGIQTTDADGRVDFDTCFPGWYSSRTIHIHFIIRRGDTEYVIGQFVFDDTLDDSIVATQPLYSTRGARDTTNVTDNVVSATTAAAYSFATARMPDGAMLAWKTIVLRGSTSDTLCNLSNGTGMGDGGMMGGPMGDGGMGRPPEGGMGGPMGDGG